MIPAVNIPDISSSKAFLLEWGILYAGRRIGFDPDINLISCCRISVSPIGRDFEGKMPGNAVNKSFNAVFPWVKWTGKAPNESWSAFVTVSLSPWSSPLTVKHSGMSCTSNSHSKNSIPAILSPFFILMRPLVRLTKNTLAFPFSKEYNPVSTEIYSTSVSIGFVTNRPCMMLMVLFFT